MRAAYLHPSGADPDDEAVETERKFEQFALRAAKRALGESEPGAVRVEVTLTDAASGWGADATATPLNGENEATATRTGATPASATEAALSAAIGHSDMREYGTVID